MNILRKILASPIVGVRWVKALELASNEDYQAAMRELDYLDEFYSGKNIEYHLLRGFVNYGLGDDIEAVRNFELSISLLRETNRYNEDEKRYLRGYGSMLGRKALKGESTLTKSSSFPRVDVSLIDLSKVGQSLRKNFPLIDQPNWE